MQLLQNWRFCYESERISLQELTDPGRLLLYFIHHNQKLTYLCGSRTCFRVCRENDALWIFNNHTVIGNKNQIWTTTAWDTSYHHGLSSSYLMDQVPLSHCLSGRKERDAARVVIDGSSFWLYCTDNPAQPSTAKEFILSEIMVTFPWRDELYQGDIAEEKWREVTKTE